jgi:hypothetical protein
MRGLQLKWLGFCLLVVGCWFAKIITIICWVNCWQITKNEYAIVSRVECIECFLGSGVCHCAGWLWCVASVCVCVWFQWHRIVWVCEWVISMTSYWCYVVQSGLRMIITHTLILAPTISSLVPIFLATAPGLATRWTWRARSGWLMQTSPSRVILVPSGGIIWWDIVPAVGFKIQTVCCRGGEWLQLTELIWLYYC